MNQLSTPTHQNQYIAPIDAENLLWYLLKNRNFAGHEFQLQCLISPYVVDFYCHEKRLVIELMDERKNGDVERIKFLENRGLTVLQFRNDAVFNRPAEVFGKIEDFLNRAPSP